MARRKRVYRSSWLLVPALLVSATAQTTAFVAYDRTRRAPVPRLMIRLTGEGEGQVPVTRLGDTAPLLRCAPKEEPLADLEDATVAVRIDNTPCRFRLRTNSRTSLQRNIMNIIIAYDGSQCSRDTLAEMDRAGLPAEGVDGVVITVAELRFPAGKLGAGVSAERMQTAMEFAHATAAQAVENLQQRFPAWSLTTEEMGGSPVGAITGCSRQRDSDLIIVGSHGRSLIGRMFMGSVSQSVMAEADCSIRIARGRASFTKGTRLLLAVDGSPHSLLIASAVASRKWAAGTQARIVAAVEPIFDVTAPPLVPEISVWDANEACTSHQTMRTQSQRGIRKREEGLGLVRKPVSNVASGRCKKCQANRHVVDNDRGADPSATMVFDRYGDPRNEQGGVEDRHHQHVMGSVFTARRGEIRNRQP